MNNEISKQVVKIKKEYTVFSKVVIAGAIFTTILMSIINGTLFNPARTLGALIALLGISFLLGIVPYFIFRNKIKNSKIIIFGIVFIFCGLATAMGNLKGKTTDIDIAKPMWVDNCANGGDEKKAKYCDCLFDSLVEKYTWEKFSKMESSPELSQSIKDLGQKCLENDGYLFGDDLKEVYIKSYVDSCVKNGSSETTCSCYVDILIERLGLEGFGEMGKVIEEKGVNSLEAEKYLDIVLEQKASCGDIN